MSELAIGVERLTAIVFVVTGLSHIAAPRAWARFFMAMRDRSAVPGFLNAYVHGPLGFLIVAFHWLWTWPAILVTLIGCALALKGAIHFVRPQLALKTMARVSEEKAGEFRIAGFGALLLGAVIFWISLRG